MINIRASLLEMWGKKGQKKKEREKKQVIRERTLKRIKQTHRRSE